jgi:endonuclease YncB( thermonuclease family)
LALLALVALTPGEQAERTVRTGLLLLLGGLLGASLALIIVAFGFGGHQKRSVYAGLVSADDVIDGDGLRMGDYAFRLAGIDAPEEHQECRRRGRRVPCGQEARDMLSEIVGGRVVVCRTPRWLSGEMERPPRETFGRPMVQCEVERGGNVEDIAALLVRAGHAVEYRGVSGHYAGLSAEARERGAGLWSMCAIRPDAWRDRNVRRAFLERGELPESGLLIGDC